LEGRPCHAFQDRLFVQFHGASSPSLALYNSLHQLSYTPKSHICNVLYTSRSSAFSPFTTHLNAPHLPNQRQPCVVVMTYSTPPVLLTSKCNMCTQVNIPVPKHHAKTHCHRTKMPKSIPPSNTAPSNTCTRSLHTIQQLSQQDRASLCS
jgi:hypothetical protein